MKNCSEIQEVLSFYIDESLNVEEKEDIEEHLQGCLNCQQELQSLQEVVVMFRNLGEEELVPPGSFRRELRKKLEERQKPLPMSYLDKLMNWVNNFPFRTWLPLAAAAVLLIVIIPVMTNGLGLFGGAKPVRDEAPKSAPAEYGIMGSNENTSLKMKMSDGGTPEIAMEDSGPQMFMVREEKQEIATDNAFIERKIIKTGQLNLEVENYKATATQIKDLVKDMQGYIVNENTHIYNRERKLLAGNLAVRIPQERFDEALALIEDMGSADGLNADSQDVTEEYVDVESRLKAMRLKEERLLTILDKTGTLGDVLAVENELANTRANLEALEGRLKYLNNRTELSTINISMRETLTPMKQIKTTGLQGVLARFQEAFVKSINGIIISLGNLIVYIGAYLPFIVLLFILLVVFWIVGRNIRKKHFNK